MSVFILYDGIIDADWMISVHRTLAAAKRAGNKHLEEPTHHYVQIEKWEFDNPRMLGCWEKATKGKYPGSPRRSVDWRKV
jgi:hypothetical protein